MSQIQKLRTLTATTETVRRQKDDEGRASLPKVADRLWAAFVVCFPSVRTLRLPIAEWPTLTRAELDAHLAAPDPEDVPGYAQIAPDRGRATVVGSESGSHETRRVEIRSWSRGRVFAVDFERRSQDWRPLAEEPWKLVRVGIDFGAEGSCDRALAVGGWYLWPDANGTDGETYEAHELPLLWSAAPEFDHVYVDAPAVS